MLENVLHYGKIVFYAAVAPVAVFVLVLYTLFSQY